MKIIGRLADDCPNGHDCQRIHDTDGDRVIVQGDRLDDEALLAALHLPENEGAVIVDRTLIYPAEMSLTEMAEWIHARHTRHLIRVENRRAYASASDGGDFARYLDGQAEPLEGAPWHARLRDSARAGRFWCKVHVVDDQLSDYERYEFDWGFRRTVAAGEDVRILHGWPELATVPDFWVIDGEHVVRMTYADDGHFVGAHPVQGPDAAAYRGLAAALWAQAVPFSAWWEAHPEFHRRLHAA